MVRIGNFGAFAPKPVIQVTYDPKNCTPTVSIQVLPGKATNNDLSTWVVRYTTDGSEVTEQSTAYTKPFGLKNAGTVRAKTFKNGQMPSGEVSGAVKTYPLMPALQFRRRLESGLKMQVMKADTWSVGSVQNGTELRSAIMRSVLVDPSCEKSACGQVWTGFLDIKDTGGYQFFTESDDGSTIAIDNTLIVDNGGLHGMERKEGIALLEKGWHAVKIVYFNAGGGYGIKAGMGKMGEKIGMFPADILFH